MSDALGYLDRYGGKDLRETLYKAFLRWYERNKQTSAEDLSEPSPALRQQLDVGHSFVGALLCNQSWRPDAKLRADVVQHTVGTQMQDQVSRLAAEELSVTAFPNDNASYEIGCYSSPTLALLEQKLDQFPSGTVFTLSHVQTPTPRAQDRFEASLRGVFEKHGMRLLSPDGALR